MNEATAPEPLNAIPRQAEGLHIAAQMISHPEFAGRDLHVMVSGGCIRICADDLETVEAFASLIGSPVDSDRTTIGGTRQHLTNGTYCSYPVRAYWFQELTVVTP